MGAISFFLHFCNLLWIDFEHVFLRFKLLFEIFSLRLMLWQKKVNNSGHVCAPRQYNWFNYLVENNYWRSFCLIHNGLILFLNFIYTQLFLKYAFPIQNAAYNEYMLNENKYALTEIISTHCDQLIDWWSILNCCLIRCQTANFC